MMESPPMPVLRRLLCTCLAILSIAASSLAWGLPEGEGPPTLVLFNWEEYLDPDILEKFHTETGVRVVIRAYDTDETKDHELAATQRGEGFDLIIGSGISLRSLAEAGWLAELPEAKMPQLVHLKERWRASYGSLRPYAVPYFWGTLGLAYRSDLVKRPESWMDYFRPDPALHGRLMLIDDSKDAIGAALKVLGYSMNSVNPAELGQAMELLQGLKPHLRYIGYFDYTEESSLGSGEVLLTMAYNGDVLTLQEHVPTVQYVVPKEGTNLWVDFIAVFDSSPNQAQAFRLIDFLNRPDIAAQNAGYVHYATPNAAAEKLLGAEFLNDPILYPPKEVLDRSESYSDLSTLGARQRTRLFSSLRD